MNSGKSGKNEKVDPIAIKTNEISMIVNSEKGYINTRLII